MIRITTQGRYALRAMVDLALHSDAAPVARLEIAERQGISADYVAQLFQKLQETGLVVGVRGPGGGYRLGRDADEIRASEVIEAVEGPVALVHCVEPGGDVCSRMDHCVTHLLWKRLSAVMKEFLDGVTLQDLVDQAQQLDPLFARNSGQGVPAGPSRGVRPASIANGSQVTKV
jgi:Rrf2 family iron-sulfur cluster assembly transcriptional regulator